MVARVMRAKDIVIVAIVIVGVAGVAFYKETRRTAGGDAGTAGIPRLVDLGAGQCRDCKEMIPILATLKREFAGRVSIEPIDVLKDDVHALERYDARVIPTQIFFDHTGKEVWRHEGFMSREDILGKFKELGFK